MQLFNLNQKTLSLLISLLLLTACQVGPSETLPTSAIEPTQEPTGSEPKAEELKIEEPEIEEVASATPITEPEPTTTPEPAAVVQATSTPAETFVPIAQQSAENNPSPYWSYFSNPGGGGAFHTIGQSANGVAIAGSDLSGAYINRDVWNSNSRWEVIGLDRGLTQTHISAIGFHPTDPDIILLGSDNGIFRSADGANSFEKVFEDGYFHDFAFGPDPQIVFATYHPEWNNNQGQLLRSNDGGRTWTVVSQNLPAGLRLIKLLSTPDYLFALSGEARFASGPAVVYRSADAGATWEQVGQSLGNIMDIAQDAQGELWLTTYQNDPDLYGQLYTSSNNGSEWQLVAQRHGVIWPAADGRLRLIEPRYQFPWDERNGVWESADSGATWEQISQVDDYDFGWSTAFFAHLDSFDGAVRTLAFNGDSVLWANSQFVFGSADGGRTFQNRYTQETEAGTFTSTGIDNIVFFNAAASERSSTDGTSAIYMAMYDMGCFRSLDGGTSWQNCNVPDITVEWNGAGGNAFTVLAEPNPARAGTVWMVQTDNIGAPAVLLRSDNFGAIDSWQASNAGLPESPHIMDIAIDPNSPADSRTLFTTVSGDVYRSVDDGWNWEPVFECGGCHFVAVDNFGEGVILAGGEAGLFRSAANGDSGSWSAVGGSDMAGDVPGIFWEWGWRGVRDIEFDTQTAGRVVVGVMGTGGGVWLSEDNGLTWQQRLEDGFIRDVHLTQTSIFAASSSAWEAGGYDPAGRGVLRSTDNGATWAEYNDGLPWPFPAKFVTLNKSQETLLMAVQGPGFYVTDFGNLLNQ